MAYYFGPGLLLVSKPPPPWRHDLLATISELGSLKENWDSYGARAVDPSCAAATVAFLLSVIGPNTPKPSIVPINRGGIQLEWHRAGADLEIEVQPPARLSVFFEDEPHGMETKMTLTTDFQPLMHLLERLGVAD